MIFSRPRWRIRTNPRGGFDVRLPAEERDLIRDLPARLSSALGSIESETDVPDNLRRLFPVAHPRDPAAEEEFVAISRAALLEHHRAALDCLEATADSTHLSADDLENWLAALNDLRLVLGTSLGVTEEMTEPDPAGARYADWICYHYLSLLTGEVVDALCGLLGPADPNADDSVPEDPWGEPLGGLRWDGTPEPEDP